MVRGFKVTKEKKAPPHRWAKKTYGVGALLVWCPKTSRWGCYVSLSKCKNCPWPNKNCEVKQETSFK